MNGVEKLLDECTENGFISGDGKLVIVDRNNRPRNLTTSRSGRSAWPFFLCLVEPRPSDESVITE